MLKLHKANYMHLMLAGLHLAKSDREEMDRIEAGRDPVDVLTAASGDPTLHAITDHNENVMAVGGSEMGTIWFVHTTHAESLSKGDKRAMLGLLRGHLKGLLAQVADHKVAFVNAVSVQNWKHIRLLKALGATFLPEPINHNGHAFLPFIFKGANHV